MGTCNPFANTYSEHRIEVLCNVSSGIRGVSSGLMTTWEPTARPRGTMYSKLKPIVEIIVTALGSAQQLVVYKALSETQSSQIFHERHKPANSRS